MESSTAAFEAPETETKHLRGKGRGGGFFALGRDRWEDLWNVETSNRLNLVVAYLVLLAGTGSDHRLTKWSAKACEEHTGVGKPRAKRAIDELIAGELVKRTENSTRMMPQYELPSLPLDDEPIFLPVALVTGLSGEASMLRRVRETGDALLLRMLIDLYGLVSLDATHGIPLEYLNGGRNEEFAPTARKVADVGAHVVWAISAGKWRGAGGDWSDLHREKGATPWARFWERVDLLKRIGAIWFEPWLFDGEELDAEPLIPLDPTAFYPVAQRSDEADLTKAAYDAARALVAEERSFIFDGDADYFVPLVGHRRAPAYREVARMRVEADTPGRRLAWKRRRTLIENYLGAFQQLRIDAENGEFSRPMQPGRSVESLS
jgi:hypothetical protein